MRLNVNDLDIEFPFDTYPQQESLMSTLVKTLQRSENALIESPTGTGKTLCLLCAILSWQKEYTRWRVASRNLTVAQDTQLMRQYHLSAFGATAFKVDRDNQFPISKIYYSSRTHSQLSQCVQEVKNTAYTPIVSVLASRDQLCCNPIVKAAVSGAKQGLCKSLVQKKGCSFYAGHEDFKIQMEAKSQVMDIEDLVRFGESKNACPFYLSQKIQAEAEIVFLPYNYIIDPKSRKSQGIDLANAVVIFDEGHNVESICSDINSFELSTLDIEIARQEISLCAQIIANPNYNPGQFIDLSPQDCDKIRGQLLKLIEKVNALNLSKKTLDILKPARFAYDLMAIIDIDAITVIKVHIKESAYITNIVNQTVPTELTQRVFSFWCFNAAIAMRDLTDLQTRSIIIASGTLSPLSNFADDLGIPFQNRIENSHVIGSSQIFVGVVPKGPRGTKLLSRFQDRDKKEYVFDLGNTILKVCETTPDGVLVFFTSYGLMATFIDSWKKKIEGIKMWDEISKIKPIFVEPRSKQDFADVFASYETTISRGSGACFFAVFRGKASEGIDFSDAKARAVLICGIPYLAKTDPKITSKQRLMNDDSRSSKSGDQWYRTQAFRAINQAIGRVIRHRKDYGAILLCDERFSESSSRNELPKWTGFQEMNKDLEIFFSNIDAKRGIISTKTESFDPLVSNRSVERSYTRSDDATIDPLNRKRRSSVTLPNNNYSDPLAVMELKTLKLPKSEHTLLSVVHPRPKIPAPGNLRPFDPIAFGNCSSSSKLKPFISIGNAKNIDPLLLSSTRKEQAIIANDQIDTFSRIKNKDHTDTKTKANFDPLRISESASNPKISRTENQNAILSYTSRVICSNQLKSSLAKESYDDFMSQLRLYKLKQMNKPALIDTLADLMIKDTDGDLTLRSARICLFSELGYFVGPSQDKKIKNIVARWEHISK